MYKYMHLCQYLMLCWSVVLLLNPFFNLLNLSGSHVCSISKQWILHIQSIESCVSAVEVCVTTVLVLHTPCSTALCKSVLYL